jgi:hypothetical protein
MAVAIRSGSPSVFTNVASSKTVSGTLSGTSQPNTGDVLIIIHCNDFYTLAAMPTPTVGGSTTGVTAITGASADGGSNLGHAKAFYYVVGSTADLTVAVTETGTADEEKNLIVYVLSGVNTTTPIDGSAAGATTASASTHVAPSVSPTGSTAYLICHTNSGGGINVASYTPPSGMTEKYDASNAASMGCTGAILQLASSGATGTKTFTPISNAPAVMLSIPVNTAASSTPVSSSDTGAGTDSTGVVVQKYTSTDTGGGTDSTGVVVQRYTDTDTGAGTSNVGTLAAAAAGSDTSAGTDSTGVVVQKYTGSDTGTGTESAGSTVQFNAFTDSESTTGTDSAGAVTTAPTGAETATGTEAAGAVARASQDADLGTATDSAGRVAQAGSDTASGTDSSGTLTAAPAGTETVSGTDAVSTRAIPQADTGTGADSAGLVTQFRSDSDTAAGADGEYLTVYKTTATETATGTEAATNRTFLGQVDNPTIIQAESVVNLLPQAKNDADTVARTEGQTLYLPGAYSKIPQPKVWSNGDDLYAGTLNKEWRDAFNWLLRLNAPAYEGYNNGTPTLTSNVAITITTDTLVRYGVTHAASDTKVYVWEPGWYWVYVGGGVNAGSVSADSGFSTVLKVNGVVATTSVVTRVVGPVGQTVGLEHLSSAYLSAGDYVEIAVAGSWTGTLTTASGDPTTANAMFLNLWWRSN